VAFIEIFTELSGPNTIPKKWHILTNSCTCGTQFAKRAVQQVYAFKTRQYLSQHISLRTSARNTRSSSVPLMCMPFRRTSFARRSFSTSDLELTATCCVKLRLSLSLHLNPDLKLICFLLLSANYSTTCSASASAAA